MSASSTSSSSSRIRLTPSDADRLVNRLKNTNLEKFYTLCKMHLSFLLHLPGPSLDDFLGQGASTWGLTPTTQAIDKHKFRHFGKKKSSKEIRCIETFPVKQETIDQLLPLVDYLSQDANLKQEGLFRKSGHIGRRQLLREKLLAGENVSVELEGGVYSAHDCASVLKTALSELPEPLLTEKLYLAHCQVTEMEDEKKQLQTLQLLLQLLPPENLHLLRRLLDLLHTVVSESSNKMTSETLGTLFAPHLLVPRKMSASELQAVTPDLTKTVAFMIDNLPQLFKLPEPLIRDIATYWSQMEVSSDDRGDVYTEDLDTCRVHRRRLHADIPITTSVMFADREASLQAAENTDTQVALAQLYAHVSSMPDSSKKRRLMKQFNKANAVTLGSTPPPSSSKHKRTRTFGDSIKKIVGRNHRRGASGHMLQLQQTVDSPCSIHVERYTSHSSHFSQGNTGNSKMTDECNDTRFTGANGNVTNSVEPSTNPPPAITLPQIRRPAAKISNSRAMIIANQAKPGANPNTERPKLINQPFLDQGNAADRQIKTSAGHPKIYTNFGGPLIARPQSNSRDTSRLTCTKVLGDQGEASGTPIPKSRETCNIRMTPIGTRGQLVKNQASVFQTPAELVTHCPKMMARSDNLPLNTTEQITTREFSKPVLDANKHKSIKKTGPFTTSRSLLQQFKAACQQRMALGGKGSNFIQGHDNINFQKKSSKNLAHGLDTVNVHTRSSSTQHDNSSNNKISRLLRRRRGNSCSMIFDSNNNNNLGSLQNMEQSKMESHFNLLVVNKQNSSTSSEGGVIPRTCVSDTSVADGVRSESRKNKCSPSPQTTRHVRRPSKRNKVTPSDNE